MMPIRKADALIRELEAQQREGAGASSVRHTPEQLVEVPF
jgi:hypothetical protein